MGQDKPLGYGWMSISIHWISALTVIGLFAAGWWMVDLTYYSEWYRIAPHYHKSAGLLLAGLTLFRLGWKWTRTQPGALTQGWQRQAASLTHNLLYLLLLAIFLSGYLISTADGRGIEVFNWFVIPALGEGFANQEDIAGLVHEWLAYSLISLVVLHALAALKHHFINRDLTLKRMLKPLEEH